MALPIHIEEISLPTGHIARFIGFVHPVNNEEIDTDTIKKLRKEIGKSEELFTEKKDPRFLPEEFIKPAQPLLDKKTERNITKTLSRGLRPIDKLYFDSLYLPLQIFYSQMPETINSTNSAEQERLLSRYFKKKIQKHLRPEYTGSNGRMAGQMLGVRSYLMTRTILEHIKKRPTPHTITIVGGIAHTLQMVKFVKNQKLYQRYGKLVNYYQRPPKYKLC